MEVDTGNGQTKLYLGNDVVITATTSTRTVEYLLTDRLGSVDAIVNAAGALTQTRGYDAFGAPRLGTWADASPPRLQDVSTTRKGFTEHEHLNAVELIHMNGRVYDYRLGRFLSVDPFIQAPLNSQSLNPYSYIMNNPLSGTDPTGYSSCTMKTGSHICSKDDGSAASRTDSGTTTDGAHVKITTTIYKNGSVTRTISVNGKDAGQWVNGLFTTAKDNSQTGSASQRPNAAPLTAPTNLILLSAPNQPRDFGSYTPDEQKILGDISRSAATEKTETERIASDPSLPDSVRESAQRQLASWAKSGYIAVVFDNFRMFKREEFNLVMQVRTPGNLASVGPSDPTAFILVVNLQKIINDFDKSVTSNTAAGYAGVSYGAGTEGITKEMAHEMRHFDPLAHLSPNGNGWTLRSHDDQERDADMWADKQWNNLNDLSK